VLRAEEVNPDGEVDLGVEGLQALEWVALALLAALAFGLRRTEAGPGEALSAASLGRGIVL
jgi:hypothetical protein